MSRKKLAWSTSVRPVQTKTAGQEVQDALPLGLRAAGGFSATLQNLLLYALIEFSSFAGFTLVHNGVNLDVPFKKQKF
ncbi:hypothetical protein PF004_g21075 [Phytophthora fragariae]|uniref:Uncharacterized protein n=1 Tax=Phytophthora fragariae TaxID=53985 RepID=A0A6G0N503_9STRA|nr:hypothetical protein PF004_g21075 [Phytophthora fragariae]